MQWLRLLAVLGTIGASATAALADRQCNVPAGYYRLVDVEADGVVEFRQSPSHRSKLLAALAAGDIVQSDGTRSPDKLSMDTTWQLVTILQTTGWVPARKLWRTLPLTIEKSDIPAAGRCGDTAPVWSLSWSGDRIRLSLYPGRFELPIQTVTVSGNNAGTVVSGGAPGISYRLVYDGSICRNADGEMIGIGKASLIVDRDGQEQLYTGCCSAAPAAFASRSVPGANP